MKNIGMKGQIHTFGDGVCKMMKYLYVQLTNYNVIYLNTP